MLISISLVEAPKLQVEGGDRIELASGGYAVRFSSPYHPPMEFRPTNLGSDIRSYLNSYDTDSFLVFDPSKKKVSIGRDWPGNVLIYYWRDEGQYLISDDLNALLRQVPDKRPSKEGIELYFSDRKHFQLHTIHAGVDLLLPGSALDIDLKTGKHTIQYWYGFHHPLAEVKDIAETYRGCLDAALGKCLEPNREIALMYSGGSDSTLILERLVKKGYKNVTAFNIKIKGWETEDKRAKRNAARYGIEIKTIEVDASEVVKDWFDVIADNYMCSSDMRIDGMFSVAPSIYRALSAHYAGRPVSVIWGLQHSYPYKKFTLKFLLCYFGAYLLSRVFPISWNGRLNRLGHFLVRILGAKSSVNRLQMSSEQLEANETAILRFFRQISCPSELSNLTMVLGAGRKKEWSMERQRIGSQYYPECRNVFPFYDRKFQENLLSVPLAQRYGKWTSVFGNPVKYKNLIVRSFEDEVLPQHVLGGTLEAVPSWHSLFHGKQVYEAFQLSFSSVREKALLDFVIERKMAKWPGSYDDYSRMGTEELEKISSAAMMAARFEKHGVSFQ